MKNNKIINFCDFYILLRLVYELQALLFGSVGTFISKIIFLFLIIVSLYYTIVAMTKFELPLFMKGLAVLLLMFTIYGLLPILIGESFNIGPIIIKSHVYLQHIYLSLLPIFLFFVFTRRGLMNEKKLQIWILIFFVTASLQFIQYQNQALSWAVSRGSDAEEFTNNVGYFFLALIPLLSFWANRKIIQYLGLAFAMAFIILSMKRGAILIGAICLVLFLMKTTKSAKGGQKIVIFVLGIIVLVFGYYFVQNMLENSLYFNARIDSTLEGDSSNRDFLFKFYWNHYVNESNPFLFMFGNGANGTLKLGHQYAHNDWLEIAINQGTIGIVIYLFFWYRFFKTCKKIRYDNKLYLALILVFIMELFKSVISMSYNDMSVYTSLCIGYCVGMLNIEQNHAVNRKTV